MKKTAAKTRHSINFNATHFFTKHIGIMGLVVVILFFVLYFMTLRISSLEQKVIVLESNNQKMMDTETSMPESDMDMLEVIE